MAKDGANVVATYEYDGRNYRIQKAAGGVTFDYYYSESWQCLEVHEAGDTANPLEQYVWHPYYIDALLVRYWDQDTNGTGIPEHYYLHDANFNVTAITDDAAAASVLERYDYTPYGELKVLDSNFAEDANGTDYENTTTYTGRSLDLDTGLYYFRNRDYGAGLGRFCQRDPIGYADGLNLYQYATSIPTRFRDPYGFAPWDSLFEYVPHCVWTSDNKADCIRCCIREGGSSSIRRQCERECDEEWPTQSANCGGQSFDQQTQCCENGQVVNKVPIWTCKGRFFGDDLIADDVGIPIMGPIAHTYIVCDDPYDGIRDDQFGFHPKPFEDGWGLWGPGSVNVETGRDPRKALCDKEMVCPAVRAAKCGTGPTGTPYFIIGVPGCDNCHQWGNELPEQSAPRPTPVFGRGRGGEPIEISGGIHGVIGY